MEGAYVELTVPKQAESAIIMQNVSTIGIGFGQIFRVLLADVTGKVKYP